MLLLHKLLSRRPICNNNPTSAPVINGKIFIICWRCIGTIISAVIISALIVVFKLEIWLNGILGISGLAIPAIIDYTFIKLDIISPDNTRRFVTGLLLGIPYGMWITYMFQLLGFYI